MATILSSRFYSGPPSPLGRLTQACRHESRGLGVFRRFGQWALVLLIRGRGGYEDERGLLSSLHPGDVIVVFPDLAQRYGPPPGGSYWEEIYLVFEGPVFDLWRKSGLLNPESPIFHGGNPVALSRAFESFLASDSAGPLVDMVRLQDLLARLITRAREPRSVAAIEKAKSLIDADPSGTPTGRSLAAKLGMGYELFRKQFRAATGVPPAHYRLQRMVEEACRLITAEGLSNVEVAARLGWSDPFHFSRCFKKYMGQTPRQYRERRLFHPP